MQPSYKIFVVSNCDYLNNTFVCLYSFFKHNPNRDVTLYVVDSNGNTDNGLDKFKVFDRLTIECIDIPELPINTSYSYYTNTIKCISAKLYIFDLLYKDFDYLMCFDTDTMFIGSIDELFVEYDKKLIGVRESWIKSNSRSKNFRKDPYLNAGLLIYKNNECIFDKYVEFLECNKDLDIYFPEQDFLNVLLSDDSMVISEKYNYLFMYYGKTDDVRMVHFALPFKPFKFNECWTSYVYSGGYMNHYLTYFGIVEEVKDMLDDFFYNECKRISKLIKLLDGVKYGLCK